MISDVHFEQTSEWLKVVVPVKRSWPYLAIYTILLVMWVVMLVWGVVYAVQIFLSGASYRFVFVIMLAVILFTLFRFGRFLRRQWATYFSNREVLLINNEEFIVRRPISIWGNTDVYDMEHVTPLYVHDKQQALAFGYGSRHIFFGEGLKDEARRALAAELNERYFADKLDSGN